MCDEIHVRNDWCTQSASILVEYDNASISSRLSSPFRPLLHVLLILSKIRTRNEISCWYHQTHHSHYTFYLLCIRLCDKMWMHLPRYWQKWVVKVWQVILPGRPICIMLLISLFSFIAASVCVQMWSRANGKNWIMQPSSSFPTWNSTRSTWRQLGRRFPPRERRGWECALLGGTEGEKVPESAQPRGCRMLQTATFPPRTSLSTGQKNPLFHQRKE